MFCSTGPTGATGENGATGATGNTGATGPAAECCDCGCVQQMVNLLSQIIELYPTDNVVVSMESGENVSGHAGALLPPPNTNINAGLLQLNNSQGVPQEAVSICRIAAIRVTSTTYNQNITYLPAPSPLPIGCGANCESAVRSYLPVNTTGAHLKAGGQTVGQGLVIENQYGVIVVVGPNNSDPSFVSTCKVEVMTKDIDV